MDLLWILLITGGVLAVTVVTGYAVWYRKRTETELQASQPATELAVDDEHFSTSQRSADASETAPSRMGAHTAPSRNTAREGGTPSVSSFATLIDALPPPLLPEQQTGPSPAVASLIDPILRPYQERFARDLMSRYGIEYLPRRLRRMLLVFSAPDAVRELFRSMNISPDALSEQGADATIRVLRIIDEVPRCIYDLPLYSAVADRDAPQFQRYLDRAAVAGRLYRVLCRLNAVIATRRRLGSPIAFVRPAHDWGNRSQKELNAALREGLRMLATESAIRAALQSIYVIGYQLRHVFLSVPAVPATEESHGLDAAPPSCSDRDTLRCVGISRCIGAAAWERATVLRIRIDRNENVRSKLRSQLLHDEMCLRSIQAWLSDHVPCRFPLVDTQGFPRTLFPLLPASNSYPLPVHLSPVSTEGEAADVALPNRTANGASPHVDGSPAGSASHQGTEAPGEPLTPNSVSATAEHLQRLYEQRFSSSEKLLAPTATRHQAQAPLEVREVRTRASRIGPPAS